MLGNIVNPVPAVYASNFQATIGIDIAQPNNGGVQLQPADF